MCRNASYVSSRAKFHSIENENKIRIAHAHHLSIYLVDGKQESILCGLDSGKFKSKSIIASENSKGDSCCAFYLYIIKSNQDHKDINHNDYVIQTDPKIG